MGAIQIHIKIGEIQTLSVENWKIIPDDRQTQIETVGGVEVQDFGHVEEGDKFSCNVTVKKSDANILFDYWHKRTFVDVEDEGGEVYKNLRVVVKSYGYLSGFKKYLQVQLEFWRV